MKTELTIAWRYLFARKSHNIINVISAISALGMAIGTAALIVILSVYNGFSRIVSDNLADINPDIRIESASGRTFNPDSLINLMPRGISSVGRTLEFSVFTQYDGHQAVAFLKGADSVFEKESGIGGHILAGSPSLHKGELDMAVMGNGIAMKLGANPRFLSPITLHYPERDSKISISNPSSSLNSIDVWPGGVISCSADLDEKLIIVPLEVAEELYGQGEVSGLELRLSNTSSKSVRSMVRTLEDIVGKDYLVLDRFRQHKELYKMMRLEKGAVFLIMILIVLIVAFNIFGSLTMLMIEKEEDMETLRAMGADDSMRRRIFTLEGWMISVFGMLAGLVIGTLLALVQQETGIVKMPGNFLVSAYPVEIQAGDILAAALGVAIVGFVIVRAVPAARRQGR